MALKGTIKDFGIADIFQLIGQQTKTGVLILRDDVDEVRVSFQAGAVVRAESSTRPKRMLLGSMIHNAGLIAKDQLEQAIKEQSRTLKKIGAIMIDRGWITPDVLREFARLQMTETVYRLFLWETGTYEFEQTEIELPSEGVDPIRADTILMEGFRMIDEWPQIRKRLPSYTLVFDRLKPLPPARDDEPSNADDLLNVDVFGDGIGPAKISVEGADLGSNERRIYELAEPGRDLTELIDLSRLGEFETCQAVLNLMSAGYLASRAPAGDGLGVGARGLRYLRKLKLPLVLGRVAGYALILVLVVLLARNLEWSLDGGGWRGTLRWEPQVTSAYVSASQIRVIQRALDVYRFQTGAYPETLDGLVDRGLLREHDLRFPYERRYFYKLEEGKILLLPPVY